MVPKHSANYLNQQNQSQIKQYQFQSEILALGYVEERKFPSIHRNEPETFNISETPVRTRLKRYQRVEWVFQSESYGKNDFQRIVHECIATKKFELRQWTTFHIFHVVSNEAIESFVTISARIALYFFHYLLINDYLLPKTKFFSHVQTWAQVQQS